VSIGAASTEDLDPDRASQSTLLATADRNLYAAKHGCRDRVITHLPRPDRRYRAARDRDVTPG